MLNKLSKLNNLKTIRYFFSTDLTSKSLHPTDQYQKYENGELISKQSLQLKETQQIQKYVLNTIKNYFTTTNKDNLTKDSLLKSHGIDSLDSVEIAMQIEEDLGYVIPAENLVLFTKPKHYINYIDHIEQFKKTNQRSPSV